MSAKSGITALSPSEHTQAHTRLLPTPCSESDVVELSSDCLPITTTSSSSPCELSELEVTDQARSTLRGDRPNGVGPQSPLTEIPPTPTLSNTHEISESEIEDHDDIQAGRRGMLPVNTAKIDEARREQMQHRHREIDPVSAAESALHSKLTLCYTVRHLCLSSARSGEPGRLSP